MCHVGAPGETWELPTGARPPGGRFFKQSLLQEGPKREGASQ